MTSSSGHTIASGDHGSSSRVPVISAINDAGERNDTPAQTPSAPLPRPSTCESRWTEPALDPARGHHDEFLGERIGLRRGQQCAERVRKQIGAFGAVYVQGHRDHRRPGHRQFGRVLTG